jgi:hypothetical protein
VAETRVKTILFVFAIAILGVAVSAPGFAQQGGQNAGSGAQNAGKDEISSPDRAGPHDPGTVGRDAGRGGGVPESGASNSRASDSGASDHGLSDHRVTDRGTLDRIAGPVVPDGVYIPSRLSSRPRAERKSPVGTAANKAPALLVGAAKHWSGERRNAAGTAAINAVGAVRRDEGNRPSPSHPGGALTGAADHARMSPDGIRTGTPQTAAAGGSAIGAAGTRETASAGTLAVAGAGMPALGGTQAHPITANYVAAGPQPPQRAHVAGINGTNFAHMGIGPGSVGGPAKNLSGIDGTSLRPRY